MSKVTRFIITAVLAATLSMAGLYVWNPAARRVGTLAEMTGEFSGFEKCFVTETLGTEDINNYEITETGNILGIQTFLKDTEISYTGRAGDVQEFDGGNTYRVILVLNGEKVSFDMDAEGGHIYYYGNEYAVNDAADMVAFHTNLPQTVDTAISRFQAMGRQLAESVAAYLEILKGKAGTLVGEYLEPIYKEYVDQILNSSQLTNEQVSREDVIEKIKRAQAIKYLAQKYDLEPEEALIDEQLKMVWETAESDIEASLGLETLIRELGISADDFWNVYQREGQRTAWRISNLEKYIADNNLPSIDEMIEELDAEFVIHDKEYFDCM